MIKIKDEKTKVRGGVAVLEKTRTPPALPKTGAGSGKGPPRKPPAETVAVAPGLPDGSKLAPPFLTQVDFDTLVWLEEKRKASGLRSRAEVIRLLLTQVRRSEPLK